MRRLPPLGALEAFVIVAQNGTLKASSEELNLSISAVSRRIQTLEAHLGVRLFDRMHHEMRLTTSGKQLLGGVSPVLGVLAHILDQQHSSGSSSLVIGVPASFASAWLFPRLAKFRGNHPDHTLTFDSAGSPLARLGGTLDAAIVFADAVDRDFEFTELKRQGVLAVCAPGVVQPGVPPWDAIAGCTLLLHRGLAEVLPCWLAAHGLVDVSPKQIEYFDSGPMLLAAAESGLGLALMLEDSVRFFGGEERLEQPFRAAVPSPYSYYFACRTGALSNRPLRRFYDWVVSEAKVDSKAVAFPA